MKKLKKLKQVEQIEKVEKVEKVKNMFSTIFQLFQLDKVETVEKRSCFNFFQLVSTCFKLNKHIFVSFVFHILKVEIVQLVPTS